MKVEKLEMLVLYEETGCVVSQILFHTKYTEQINAVRFNVKNLFTVLKI